MPPNSQLHADVRQKKGPARAVPLHAEAVDENDVQSDVWTL